MPKSPMPRGAGNVNMKSKKERLMSCRCCVCIDFRDDELKKEHLKEIQDWSRSSTEQSIALRTRRLGV